MIIKSLRRLLLLTYASKIFIINISIVSILSAAMSVGISITLKPFIDNSLILGKLAKPEVFIFIAFSIGAVLLKFLRKTMISMLAINAELKLNKLAGDKFSNSKLSYFDEKKEGELVNSVSNRIESFYAFIESNLEKIIYTPISFLFTFIGLFIIDYKVAFLIIPIIIVGIIVDVKLSDKLISSASTSFAAENELLSFQKETVENYSNIRMSRMESYILENHRAKVENVRRANNVLIKQHQKSYIPALINEYMPTIALAFIAGIKVVNGNGMSYGEFMALLSLVYGASLPFARYLRSIAKLKSKIPLMEELEEITSMQATSEEIKDDELGSSRDIIALENVYFSYEDRLILENINLSVKKGKKIGIIGESGSGKTTLLKIILGTLIPQKGKAYLAGLISEKDMAKFWGKVAYVDNNHYIFDGNIAYNITLNRGELSEENKKDLRDICKELEILDLLNNDSEDLNQFGQNLSGGQRMKISVARALYKKDTELLVLDEPTAAFDYDSEKALKKVLQAQSKSVIISTHRKELLDICDKVYKLENASLKNIRSRMRDANDEN